MRTRGYNVGIVGCGLMGGRRAEALECFGGSRLSAVADTDEGRARALAERYGCGYSADWREVTGDDDLDVVIVATTNDALADVTVDAIRHGKHVLVEKPAGRNSRDIRRVIREHEKNRDATLKVGYNLRFHPAILKAKHIVETGDVGEVMYVRARYGHGGRPGYEREWRADKARAGGGEMLDQGSHLVDLSRYFLGEFREAAGVCKTYYWDMEVEDNCFAILETGDGRIAQLHASCTQWKNTFNFEVYTERAQLAIDGLGGSYGRETLTCYRMGPGLGRPKKRVYTWGTDTSWNGEYGNLLDSIDTGTEPNGSIYDAYETIRLVEGIYKAGMGGCGRCLRTRN